jgi:16S rRNA (guanine1207-N2)-methyltransferase
VTAEFFGALRREPDVEAPDLVAVDATDRLLLDTAAPLIAAAPDAVAVVDDAYGALTLGAAALHGATGVRVHQDSLAGEVALARNAQRVGVPESWRPMPLGPELVEGARVVLVRAPRGLDALRDIAEVVAAADPDVTVLVGGRVKHMTLGMNDVLRDSFADVTAGLARQKSRLLTARGPRPGARTR